MLLNPFYQKSPFHSAKKLHGGDKYTHAHTDIATYRLNQPRGQFSESYIATCLPCCIKDKQCKIAKRCPKNTSSVVKVSSFSYQKTVLSFVRKWVVRIWDLIFFLTIWVGFFHNFSFLSFVNFFFFFMANFTFWVWFLFEVCHNSNLEFYHNLGFWVLKFGHN